MSNALALNQATNAEVYRASTDAAGLCREIVLKTAMEIQGRKYVRVEGWQAIAVAHGCAGSARDVERIEGGVRAIGEIKRMSDGMVIAAAEGFVGEDETTWFGGEVMSYGKRKMMPKRPDYAIRAMAQTRAISRAARSAFAHVVVLIDANLSTTPAEEVPMGGFDDEPRNITPPAPKAAAAPEPKPAEKKGAVLMSAVQLDDELDRCKTQEALDAWNKLRAPDIAALKNGSKDALGIKFQHLADTLPKGADMGFGIGDDDIPDFGDSAQ